MKRPNNKNLIVNIVLGIMAVVCVICAVKFLNEVSWTFQQTIAEPDILWVYIDHGNYDTLSDAVDRNRAYGVEETKEYTECYAIADYYQAALMYKVKTSLGKTQEAEKYKEQMDKCVEKLGDFMFVVEDIDEILAGTKG